MKYIISSTIGLLIVVLSGIYLNYCIYNDSNVGYNTKESISLNFEVIGTANKPVDKVTLSIEVTKLNPSQETAKSECDAASEKMISYLNNVKEVNVNTNGIEIQLDTDYEKLKSNYRVTRKYDVSVTQINLIEEIISTISKIDGCVIRSTIYHTNKIPEIRKSALKDGKTKIDDYCNNLIATLNGSKIKIKDIRIQEESDWSNLSSGVYFSPPPVSESLQNVQLKKNVEIRLRLNIDVEVEMQ